MNSIDVVKGRLQILVDALNALSKASILYSLSYIVGFVFSIIMLVVGASIADIQSSITGSITGFTKEAIAREQVLTAIAKFKEIIIPAAISSVISFIISYTATIVYLRKSIDCLRDYKSGRYGTPRTLIYIGYLAGYPVSVIGALSILYSLHNILDFIESIIIKESLETIEFREIMGLLGPMMGAAIVSIIGFILLFLGLIGLLIILFRLSDDTQVDMFQYVAIILIIVMVLGGIANTAGVTGLTASFIWNILGVLAYLLLYKACITAIDRVVDRMNKIVPPPKPPEL